MDRTTSAYDLRDALSQPGCPVCRLTARDTHRFLEGLLWEQVTDPDTRRRIRQGRGFCPDHTRQLAQHKASLGVAILTQDVIHTLVEALEAARFQAPARLSPRRAKEALDRSLPSAATAELLARMAPQAAVTLPQGRALAGCLACEQAGAMEDLYLDALLDGLPQEGGLLPAFAASDGLCLAHLRQILARARERPAFEALVGAQAAIWQRLDAQLGEFIRKSDYHFRDETWGPERDAWQRAIAALGGSTAPESG